jgi:N-acetylated-alpha-linked acidic dipeptidase
MREPGCKQRTSGLAEGYNPARMGRQRLSSYLWLVVFGLTIGLLLVRSADSDVPGERRLGFTAAALARQRAVERRYAAAVSTSAISDAHQALTRRPHRAGTEGARQVADFLARALEEAGLEVEVTEYLAYLSDPRSVQVELVSPVREPLAVVEPADARDPDTAHPELDPGFIAYSPSADVTAPVVFVNYGLPADYAALKGASVDVAGRIVLVRYGRSHRAVKVYSAEQAGAAGIILYSDPADDGAARGAVWPDGMWRAPDLLQRGNAKYSWLWHGDPLTPGVAATEEAPSLSPESAPTLPKIPVAVLSAREAEKIWRHGAGAAAVRLRVDMRAERKPIRNLIGRLRGASEPDRWVILGTHHDAWTFGGIDPGSSAAVVLEVARGIARLVQAGWRPTRSLLFALWDAEEYGLIGSTEFAEDRARELQERAVVYINSDMYTRGRLVAGGVPSLRDFVAEATRDALATPATVAPIAPTAPVAPSAPVASDAPVGPFVSVVEPELNALGSGADFVAFQDYLGVPTLTLEFLFEGGYGFGAYHSAYDSRFYMEQVADPGFVQGATLARVLGLAVMRFASMPVLPFRYSHYAGRIDRFLQDAEQWRPQADGPGVPAVDTSSLRSVAALVAARARAVEDTLDAELAAGRIPANVAAVNDALARLEQTLLDTSQPASQRWYRHVIYGWDIYSMYDGQPLPRLAEAMRRGDVAAMKQEQGVIREALGRMQQHLEAIEALLRPTNAH